MESNAAAPNEITNNNNDPDNAATVLSYDNANISLETINISPTNNQRTTIIITTINRRQINQHLLIISNYHFCNNEFQRIKSKLALKKGHKVTLEHQA